MRRIDDEQRLLETYNQTVENISRLLVQTLEANLPAEMQNETYFRYYRDSAGSFIKYAHRTLGEQEFSDLFSQLQTQLSAGNGITDPETARLFFNVDTADHGYFVLSPQLRADVAFILKHISKIAGSYRHFEPEIRSNPQVLAASLRNISSYKESVLQDILGDQLPDLADPEITDEASLNAIIREVIENKQGGIYLLPLERLSNEDLLFAMMEAIINYPAGLEKIAAEVTNRQLDGILPARHIPSFYSSLITSPEKFQVFLRLPKATLAELFRTVPIFGENLTSLTKMFLTMDLESNPDLKNQLEALLLSALDNQLQTLHKIWTLQVLINDHVKATFPTLYAKLQENLAKAQQEMDDHRDQEETATMITIARILSQGKKSD